MVFSGMPGNPLTPAGLRQRLNNASSRGISSAGALSKYFRSLPGNPLTPAGLRQRLNNTSPSGRDLSTLGGTIGPGSPSPAPSAPADSAPEKGTPPRSDSSYTSL